MTYPITEDQFRADFPEFANVDAYPSSSIQLWFNVARSMLSPFRWSTAAVLPPNAPNPPDTYPSVMDLGTGLFVAHNLVLDRQNALSAQLTAQDGLPGPPGVSTGSVASTSVGPVSVSYNAGATLDMGAGHWNLTIYGSRFARLAKFAGKGGAQLNTPAYGLRGQVGWGGWF